MPPLLKPPSCRGCPFEHKGRYWVPDEIIPDSEVTILSQAPGADEEAGRKLIAYEGAHKVYEPHPPAPLLGTTGYDLGRKYLPLAGLERGHNVSLANPIRCRVNNSNELPPIKDKVLKQAVEHCQRVYYRPPESTKLVVAEGAVALYAATGEDGTDSPGHKISRGIEGWRGWLLPWNPPPKPKRVWTDIWYPGLGDLPVLATYHLASLYRSPWLTPVSQRDWSKVQPMLQGKWPEPFPRVNPVPPDVWPSKVAFDTEFWEDGGRQHLIRYSMTTRRVPGAPELWVVEAQAHQVPLHVPSPLTVAFHSMEADVDHLHTLLGHHNVQLKIEDSMYLHAVLAADLDHDLDFVGSLYGRVNRTKHLLRTNPRVYAGGDALMTWDAYEALQGELDRDPQVKNVYYTYQLPLAGIIHKARARGLRVIPGRVEQALQAMGQAQTEAEALAQAHVGWPLNLQSTQQVGHELFEVEGL